jgi:hypothetical protein
MYLPKDEKDPKRKKKDDSFWGPNPNNDQGVRMIYAGILFGSIALLVGTLIFETLQHQLG